MDYGDVPAKKVFYFFLSSYGIVFIFEPEILGRISGQSVRVYQLIKPGQNLNCLKQKHSTKRRIFLAANLPIIESLTKSVFEMLKTLKKKTLIT